MYISRRINYSVVECHLANVLIVHLFKLRVYLISVYRPPSSSNAEDAELMNFLIEFCMEREVIVQGDFNLPHINWASSEPFPNSTRKPDSDFLDTFTSLGLQQVVRQSTVFPSGNILDLFLTNNADRVGSCEIFPPMINCIHSPIVVSYVFQDSSLCADNIYSAHCNKLWSRGRYDLVRSIISDIDWEAELSDLPPDLQYRRFLSILTPIIDRYVPQSTVDRLDSVPWSKNPPRSMVRARKDSWLAFRDARQLHGRRSPHTYDAWLNFCQVNSAIKNFAIDSQKRYERGLIEQIKTHPKLFHGYINHKKVGRPSLGPLRTVHGFLTDDPSVMAECFAQAFSSVYVSSLPINNVPHQTCSNLIDDLVISPSIVEMALGNLDGNSSMGEDCIHPKLLKSLSHELSFPLCIIFKNSLETGFLPNEWLSSLVVPIYKKSQRYDPLNYRPISLTSVPCKVLEKLIVSHITEFIETNSLISPHQFGFRSGHSTVDQLLLTYNDVSSMVDRGRTVDLVFFDFSKAFDVVCHHVLIEKLTRLGITGPLLIWIEYFLTRRRMKVRVRDCYSAPREVTSGVPQGSVLGPMLFIIFINYIVNPLTCKYKIFADDIKLYLAFDSGVPTAADFQEFQSSIDSLLTSSDAWGLKLNVSKCAVLRFSPRSSPLPFSGQSPYKIGDEFIKFSLCHADLGVSVDRTLRFHDHVRQTVAIAANLSSNLLRSTLCRDSDFMINLFVSHIRPKLEYASPLWNVGFISDTKLLESVQRRWTKAIDGLQNVPYGERLKCLNLFSMKVRLLRGDIIQV